MCMLAVWHRRDDHRGTFDGAAAHRAADALPTDRINRCQRRDAAAVARRAAADPDGPQRRRRRRLRPADLRGGGDRSDRRSVVGLVGGVRADGTRPRAAQHPRPRGRPPAAVPEPLRQRLRRSLGARLPDACSRSTPTAASTSPTTATRWAPTSPTSTSIGATRSRPRPGTASCVVTSPERAPTRTSAASSGRSARATPRAWTSPACSSCCSARRSRCSAR